jgi:ribose/xylose/arabinose/galactoside ABC-type transport system permease subunit
MSGNTVAMPRGTGVSFLPPFKIMLPLGAMILMFAAIFVVEPRSLSYFGLTLLLNLVLPSVFASMAQMSVIAINDIDLGIGPFISLTSCIAATWLNNRPVIGALMLLAAVGAYMVMGALIHLRQLPSIVVTLGASFVWLGCALLLLPSPGGAAPGWLAALVNLSPPVVPLPVLVAILVGVIGQFLLMRTARGAVLRGIGGNPRAVEQAGWSLLGGRVTLYGIAGACGVIAGLLLTGINTSGDANVGAQYTLTSIAAVIVGGGEFTGGDVSPAGTVIGTLIMLLTGSVLSFVNVSTNWQLSVQGAILIVVLGLRAFGKRN